MSKWSGTRQIRIADLSVHSRTRQPPDHDDHHSAQRKSYYMYPLSDGVSKTSTPTSQWPITLSGQWRHCAPTPFSSYNSVDMNCRRCCGMILNEDEPLNLHKSNPIASHQSHLSSILDIANRSHASFILDGDRADCQIGLNHAFPL